MPRSRILGIFVVGERATERADHSKRNSTAREKNKRRDNENEKKGEKEKTSIPKPARSNKEIDTCVKKKRCRVAAKRKDTGEKRGQKKEKGPQLCSTRKTIKAGKEVGSKGHLKKNWGCVWCPERKGFFALKKEREGSIGRGKYRNRRKKREFRISAWEEWTARMRFGRGRKGRPISRKRVTARGRKGENLLVIWLGKEAIGIR